MASRTTTASRVGSPREPCTATPGRTTIFAPRATGTSAHPSATEATVHGRELHDGGEHRRLATSEAVANGRPARRSSTGTSHQFTGSMKIRTVPPQVRPTRECIVVTVSERAQVGVYRRPGLSSAASTTAPSTQPPDTEPATCPSIVHHHGRAQISRSGSGHPDYAGEGDQVPALLPTFDVVEYFKHGNLSIELASEPPGHSLMREAYLTRPRP
jgi:hypothetical protein